MPKKRVAILLGYNGGPFKGSQINGEEATVERAVCDSIKELGYFSEQNARDYSKVGLQRSSRTDKGVHAAMQVLSLKVETSAGKTIEALKSGLKGKLRELGMCLYEVIPVPRGFEAKTRCESRVYEYVIPLRALESQQKGSVEDRLKVLRHAFSLLEGTHDFHNFTVRTQEKGTSRFIKQISCSDPFVESGQGWVRVAIYGQSFMMHQIRKMMGLSILAASRFSSPSRCAAVMERVFGREECNVPKAPSALLLLDRGVFDNYNRKFGESHGTIEVHSPREAFKKELYRAICTPENAKTFEGWEEAVMKHRGEFEYLLKHQDL